MEREIKFRGLDKNGMWRYGYYFVVNEAIQSYHYIRESSSDHRIHKPETVGQFTGLLDKNGKEIYEGDIFRIEESSEDDDRIFYVVITWVKEWAMFCSLLVESEYFDYLNDGIEALDEPMFWTYTLEDTNSRKHFLCGNIYQNQELILEAKGTV
jgi:uncharacterized phage protein (TIGR01671 family)